MKEFVFKRALIRSEEIWKLDGTQLVGPTESIDLGDVTVCNFNYTPLKGSLTSSELKLSTGTKSVNLDCVGKVQTEHRDTFLRLVVEIFGVLRAQRPDVRVTSTGADVMAWGFAGIGSVSVLWGIYFAASNYTDNDGSFALGVGAVMGLLGVFMIWVGSPWNSNKPKTLTEATEWLERLRAIN